MIYTTGHIVHVGYTAGHNVYDILQDIVHVGYTAELNMYDILQDIFYMYDIL